MPTNQSIQLYRSILRAHRKLPRDIRIIGDSYVKNEFHLHKKITSEREISQFGNAWKQYLSVVQQQSLKYGKDLGNREKLVLSPEQEEKLNELKSEAKKKGSKKL
jgi:hypothetical protein